MNFFAHRMKDAGATPEYPGSARHCVLLVVLLCGLFASCVKQELDLFSGPGKRPVYVPVSELGAIENLPPQPIAKTGTIFLRDTLLFLLEQKKGIHVFDIRDSLNTVNLTFFQLPAVTDFTIVGNRLYADSWRDLITIDISDLYAIRLVDRKTNVFSPVLYPPLYQGIFECVDESRGAVVDWIDADLVDVRCTTVN
ncbi:MAG: hypothetical protein IPM98_19440 [Lewinellaceae bacterium]|nr:hypothetical protein [Lewinellaceae bacterium]